MAYKRWQGPTRPVSNGATVVRLVLESAEWAGRLRCLADL